MKYVDIKVNYSFKFIRYVGPFNKTCVISGLEFYGYEASTKLEANKEILYQPTNLPLVVINTEGKKEPSGKTEYINCTVYIIDEGKRDKKASGKIKLRGNATMRQLKKPYQIKFDSKEKMLDLPSKAKKWTLLANHSDKTLIRNYLAFKASSILGLKYTPACRFVDVIFNGEFEGNFNLCDKPEVGKGRLELDEMDENCNEEPEISGGYLIEACGYAKQDEFYGTSEKGILFTLRYPNRKDITDQQLKYLNEKLNEVESQVYEGNTKNVDVDSFIKYALVQEIAANVDAVWSTYMFKERGDDKIYFGPVWDFDIAFGNDLRAYPLSSKTNLIYKYSGSAGTMKDFYTKILSDEKVLQKFKDKWKEITEKKILDNEVMKKIIDETTELIEESRTLNFKRWDILIRRVMINPVVLCTYDKEIEYLKGFMDERFEQLNGIIANATVESLNEKINQGGWGGNGGGRNDRNRNNDNKQDEGNNKNRNLREVDIDLDYQRGRNNTRNDWGNRGNKWRDPLGEIQKNCID